MFQQIKWTIHDEIRLENNLKSQFLMFELDHNKLPLSNALHILLLMKWTQLFNCNQKENENEHRSTTHES